MIILTLKERANIEVSVNEFGNDNQRGVWRTWKSANPQVRCRPDDPEDDGNGPIPAALREVIEEVVHQRFDYLMRLVEAPTTSEDDACDLINDALELKSVYQSFTDVWPEW